MPCHLSPSPRLVSHRPCPVSPSQGHLSPWGHVTYGLGNVTYGLGHVTRGLGHGQGRTRSKRAPPSAKSRIRHHSLGVSYTCVHAGPGAR
eukprot:3220125-Rhodomonas_salina.1